VVNLINSLGIKDDVQLMEVHRQWVGVVLKNGSNTRDGQWTENTAVGKKEFVLETKERLSAKAVGRKISGKMVIMNERFPQFFKAFFLALKSAVLALKTALVGRFFLKFRGANWVRQGNSRRGSWFRSRTKTGTRFFMAVPGWRARPGRSDS
jgi:hypothetical protein